MDSRPSTEQGSEIADLDQALAAALAELTAGEEEDEAQESALHALDPVRSPATAMEIGRAEETARSEPLASPPRARNPLQHAALEPDQAWGKDLRASCSCGRSYPLWQARCPTCRAKNAFPKLLQKRKRLERFLEERIQKEMLPRRQAVAVFSAKMRLYRGVLQEIRRRPFPARDKKEKLEPFLGKVIRFLQSTLRAASPRTAAVETFSSLQTSSRALVVTAQEECDSWLADLTGLPRTLPPEPSLGELASGIGPELREILIPYGQCLQTLQVSENRLLRFFKNALEVLQKGRQRTGIAGLWDKARSMVGQHFQILQFGTAIWRDEEEWTSLRRLDLALFYFLEQIDWFLQESDKVWERLDQQWQLYHRSLDRFLISELTESLARISPGERKQLIHKILSLRGVGFFWWRLLFGR